MKVQQASRRVLIADDDPTLVGILSAVVAKEGFVPVAVKDGREALKLLEKDSDFAAAIFDIQMPHLEGPQLIRYMQTENRLKRIPTMIMTANKSFQASIESFAAGAVVFLPKPFTTAMFQSMLKMLLQKSASKSG